MSEQQVRNYFTDKGLSDPVFILPESGATVDMASKVIGIEPAYIAKTLAFKLKDKDVLIVMRGDFRIDNKKYKQCFKTKAKMMTHDEVTDVTGHPVGGLCPFGLKNKLDVYLDVSIKNFDYVYPAAGSRMAALKISPSEMQQLTSAEWVDVCQE